MKAKQYFARNASVQFVFLHGRYYIVYQARMEQLQDFGTFRHHALLDLIIWRRTRMRSTQYHRDRVPDSISKARLIGTRHFWRVPFRTLEAQITLNRVQSPYRFQNPNPITFACLDSLVHLEYSSTYIPR